MSTQNPEDREFEELLKETPMSSEAPEELKDRLRALAAKPARRPIWAPRLAFAAGAAAVLALGAMLMWPTQASAKTLQKVVDATNQARSFLIQVDQSRNGTEEHVRVAAIGARIDVRREGGERVQIDGTKMQVYEPNGNTLTTFHLGGVINPEVMSQIVEQGIGEGMKQFDVRKMVADYKAEYGERNARISGIYVEDDRQVYTIDLQEPKGRSWAKITVDANSDLPVRIQAHEEGTDVDMRLNFGGEVVIEPLESSVPTDAKRLEFDLGALMKEGMKAGEGMGSFGRHGARPDPKDMEKLGKLFENLGNRERQERRP